MSVWAGIADQISRATGQLFTQPRSRSIGGGCINRAAVLESGGQRYFVKMNTASSLDMFAAEAEGLQEIAHSKTIAAPLPICWGIAENEAYLVLSYVEFGAGRQATSAQLGEQLAAMHQTTKPQFGWHRDNTIGSTPQINQLENDWVQFWKKHRLRFQLSMAAQQGYRGNLQRNGERLLEELGDFFSDYQPLPSLLHGDLWSGNYASDTQGQPVIFDPAVYYGDREADLAMTELFGGFPTAFYHAYQAVFPLDPGYRVRKTLYNLYHIINHLNLFGSGYLSQAERMTALLLSELGIRV